MNTSVMFSSKTDLWETPQDLFDKLNEEFDFTLDVCVLPQNAKCAAYFSPADDGLKQPWSGRVWCNPPYGHEIGKWVAKAADAKECEVVVMLLPARTDTRWFHEYIYNRAEVRFLRGRLKFGGQRTLRLSRQWLLFLEVRPMSGNEFKEFWELLQHLFPFDFKTEGAMRLWAKHMQSAPYDMAVAAIRRWKRENELVRMNIAPEAEIIAESSKYYCGYSKAFYTGLMRSKRLIEKEREKGKAEEANG